MSAQVLLVWMLFAFSPGKLPIVVMFETQKGCEANLADTFEQAKKQELELSGKCINVRLVQSIQEGGV